MEKIKIIAEIGENHMGNMETAKQMIVMSANAGADYVKFQLYDPNETAESDPEREWFFKVALNRELLLSLIESAKENNVKPLCTPWDIHNAKTLRECGLDEVKIASFLITDMELLEYINNNFRVVFMSTGMSSLEEIDKTVSRLNNIEELNILHCVSDYPLRDENANLNTIDILKERYKEAIIGYSDHSIGIKIPIYACVKGAKVIEKHVTMDKNQEGTDHIFSADPDDLKEMIKEIRNVEMILGKHEKKLTDEERTNQDFLRNRFHHGKKWKETLK